MRLNCSVVPVLAGKLFLALPVLMAGVVACSSSAAPPAGPPPPMPVQFEVLEASPIEQVGDFVGTIKSLRTTTVQPQAEGFLTRILTRSGARVSPGTPLFEIDAGGQQAVVSSLEAQRASREADAAYARQQTERTESLVKAGAGSQQELDQAAAALKTAEAQLQAIEQQIRQQQVELNYYRVVAQTSGVVGDIPVRLGDRVTRSTVLTTVEDNSGLEVYVNVPIPQAPLVSPGVPVRIVDADGAVLAESKISFIASSVDDQTQTLLVKAPITPAEGTTLRSDQIVRVQLVWSVNSGLRVPVIAVQRINSRHFVFVAEQTAEGGLVARQRPITVGPVVGENYIVREGLTAGDRVILAGTQKIGDGAPVQMLPAPPPAASGGR
ncbi:MAG: efflux RND transporter periplasmic adaptor subunit [Vicinamibacterales bacterium]